MIEVKKEVKLKRNLLPFLQKHLHIEIIAVKTQRACPIIPDVMKITSETSVLQFDRHSAFSGTKPASSASLNKFPLLHSDMFFSKT
jgi:hypothetical protein